MPAQNSAAEPNHRYREVLAFWFGELDQFGLASPAHVERWWAKDDALDAEIRERFGSLHAEVSRGTAPVAATPESTLAQLIVLDQFSRNLDRGSAAAYANDEVARRLALDMIRRGDDRRLPPAKRSFVYLPFMHSESLEDQEFCEALFRVMVGSFDGPAQASARNSLDFATRHRVIIERFGRFPHRNHDLGRDSTAEELAFLREDGSSF